MASTRVSEILRYFTSPQWRYFLKHVMDVDANSVYHAHLYVRTNVHPEDLEQIMFAYFELCGCPLSRSIDRCAHYPPAAGLHGIMPEGRPFFDFFFLYDPNVTLAENLEMPLHSTLLEREHNLLIWTADSMKTFARQYLFEQVGLSEQGEIERYFSSKHWKDCIRNILDSEVVHPHSYVELNFDPKILELMVLRELSKMGWTVERSVPCTFDVHGEWRGKIAFVLGYPEKMFDIGWKFNPNNTITPSTETWCLGTRGHDLWTKAMWNACIEAGNYERLQPEELERVISQLSTVL